MSYYFRGTTGELTSSILNDLQKAAEGGPARSAYFSRGMAGLVGIDDRQREKGAISPEALEQFWKDLYFPLLGFLNDLSAYIRVATIHAEDEQPDEWFELCICRSAVQLLKDKYPGTPIAEEINSHDLDAFDSALRQMGLVQGPVPDEAVPKGLPNSHWWWWYPRLGGNSNEP